MFEFFLDNNTLCAGFLGSGMNDTTCYVLTAAIFITLNE